MAERGGTEDEIELADAQVMLLKRRPTDYYLVRVDGQAIDAGCPAGYAAAWRVLSQPEGMG